MLSLEFFRPVYIPFIFITWHSFTEAIVLVLIFMRQSQRAEQSKLMGSSDHEIKYIQKEPKKAGPISEGDMTIRRNSPVPHAQAHSEFSKLRPHTQMLARHGSY